MSTQTKHTPGSPAKGDRVHQADYGVGTVTDLNVYHTVIDFDAHGLRRFVTNLVVLEKTDDPGPTASERRAISKVRLREERAAAKIAKANPPPPRPSRRRQVTTDDDATPA